MNKQRLANKIWESANKMRSKIEANEYKDYILGFIFYKYLSDKEVKFLKENDYTDELLPTVTEEDTETVEWLQKELGYFIAYENLFSTWLKMGSDFDVGNVTDALSAFARLVSKTHQKLFDNIFKTLETGLSKLGDTSGARTKAISGLLQLIKDIPMDGQQDYDVLGFIYEYLISQFAANAGKKAGEFYTPHEVSVLMSEIIADFLKGREKICIYDPTSGSGSLLINIGRCISKYSGNPDGIKYYAQELKENTYNLTRMNLVMRGIKPDNIYTRNADTLEDDWPFFDESDPFNTYTMLPVDAVVSNPPYSQAWNPVDKESDPRYKYFGVAPKSTADYAFLLHDLYHLKADGIMTIVLPHGVLFRGGEEGKIRQNLVEKNHIDAIIGLPANIFFGTGIPTIIMVLRQVRENTDVLIIDASKGFEKEGKNNKLRACDIKKITDAVRDRADIPKFSRKVPLEEIRENEYNLNIPRYVDSSKDSESYDLYALMFGGVPTAELDRLGDFWSALPHLRGELFSEDGSPYAQLKVSDIKSAIRQHPDVDQYREKYWSEFGSFYQYLEKELLTDTQSVSISKEEQTIWEYMEARLEKVPLIEKYAVYQLLDDEWKKISADLEIIQTEGIDACRAVDPVMVVKKKDGKEVEVQDGWKGRIVPFKFAQICYLIDEYKALEEMQKELEEYHTKYDEIAEDLTEEQRSEAYFDEEKNSFVIKEVKKRLKELKGDNSSEAVSLSAKLNEVIQLDKDEKNRKKAFSKSSDELTAATIEVIHTLDDEQIHHMLCLKWIEYLTGVFSLMPYDVVNEYAAKIESLCEKYRVTFDEIESEISDVQVELCGMIDELCGNDFDQKALNEFKRIIGGESVE